MEGGVVSDDTATPIFKNVSETYFDIIDVLCNRFMSLSPLEVINATMSDVFDIYVNCIIHDKREKGETSKEDVWVTSKTANWH